jgi:DNA-binding SARP family transcriptional activator
MLHIHLFGKFQVCYGKENLPGFEARRVQELFSYLLLYRDRPHSRDALATLLWGNKSTAQSKKYLRQALWQLQTALDSQSENDKEGILEADTEWIQINPHASFWLDVTTFTRAYASVQGVPGPELNPDQLEALKQTITIYQGDLLENWYQDWCLYQRERLQNMYLAILDKLMGYCEAYAQYEEGIAHGTFILGFDQARERTHRRLMRLHYLAGDRTAALRQYDRCTKVLDEELGVEPGRSTATLYQQIRTDNMEAIISSASLYQINHIDKSPLINVLQRLKSLQRLLSNVQDQIHQEIQVAERTLDNRQ